MSNMSYCMFENTYRDLEQCVSAMEDAENINDLDMNSYEQSAFYAMFNMCRNFLAEHERLLNAQNQREREAHDAAFTEAIGE